MQNILTLTDWRRRVAELYAEVRRVAGTDPADACELFRTRRDALFASHPQTPLDANQLEHFSGVPYYAHDGQWRTVGTVDWDVPHKTFSVELGSDGLFTYERRGRVDFTLRGQATSLYIYWIRAYGGGIFLPFQDATNGDTTYGGGRYLFDTIKGADLGGNERELVLDFNFAYNPSCAYNSQWICPLSPPENQLSFAVTAGEKVWTDQ